MSRETSTHVEVPRLVDVVDRSTRRRAARVVAFAYLGSPTGLALVGVSLLVGVPFFFLMAIAGSWVAWATLLGLAIGSTAATFWVATYAAPLRRGVELAYVRLDNGAEAVMTLHDGGRPTSGRDADLHAAAFAAWPRRRGAGTALAFWVLAQATERRRRITLTAWPRLSRVYIEKVEHLGVEMVDDGRTAGILVRLATTEPR